MYMVFRQGTSNPVSHMSRTITTWNWSLESLKRTARASRRRVFTVPIRAQLHDCIVRVHADAATHAHDHRLALNRRQPVFKVLNQIACHNGQAFLGADNSL